MLSIKLKPVGRKHQITYRVVVAEKRSKLKGKYVENIGWVDPHADKFEINKERAEYWINTGGAQPTDSVYNFLVRAGIIKGSKRPVHAKKKISEEEIKAEGKQEKESAVQDSKEETEVSGGKEKEEESGESEETPEESDKEEKTEEKVEEKELSEEDKGESKEEKEEK